MYPYCLTNCNKGTKSMLNVIMAKPGAIGFRNHLCHLFDFFADIFQV